jgi:small subunit ribosomal protein S26e
MPKKRRNGGRNKKNKGRAIMVRCLNCTRIVGKDKAIKRFVIKNMVDGSSKRDIEEASAYSEELAMPKIYVKNIYCVSCAIHARVVKVRSTESKRIRFISKYRTNQEGELNKMYRIANRRNVENNNPFKKSAEEDAEA